ncbi:MAG: hypothetical protein ACRYGR_08620 [Janthinobacterium lividum]
MPLTPTQEAEEHKAKMDNLRADTELKAEQTRGEPWKVMAAVVSAVAITCAAVFGVFGYILGAGAHH